MKQNGEVIVFRSRETGAFLESYKDRGTLAFTAEYTDLTNCLKIPRSYYEKDKKVYKALAKAFECEVVVVEIDYKLRYPNGAEVKSIDNHGHDIEKMLDGLLGLLKGE